MPTYNSAAVSDTAIAFEKPITLQQGRGLRDNPLAIREGSSGAPKVLGRALDVFAGEITISGMTEDGFTGLDGRTWFRCDFMISNSSGGLVNIQMRFSNDNGSSYGSWQTIFSINLGESVSGVLRFNLDSGAYAIKRQTTGVVFQATSGTLTVPSSANAFEMRSGTSSVNGSVDVYSFGGVA